MVKATTIRLPESLDKQIADFAEKNELSKNQVIKQAVRKFLPEQELSKKENMKNGSI